MRQAKQLDIAGSLSWRAQQLHGSRRRLDLLVQSLLAAREDQDQQRREVARTRRGACASIVHRRSVQSHQGRRGSPVQQHRYRDGDEHHACRRVELGAGRAMRRSVGYVVHGPDPTSRMPNQAPSRRWPDIHWQRALDLRAGIS